VLAWDAGRLERLHHRLRRGPLERPGPGVDGVIDQPGEHHPRAHDPPAPLRLFGDELPEARLNGP
jgi:hypothetical protein